MISGSTIAIFSTVASGGPSSGAIWGLLGTAVGAFAAIAASALPKYLDFKREKDGLFRSICAEIESILKISDVRKQEEIAEMLISRLKAGENVHYKLVSPVNYANPVFDPNAGRIGILGVDAGKIVTFYTNLGAIRADRISLSEGPLSEMPPVERGSAAEHTLKLWRETKIIGQLLVAKAH